MNYNKRRPFSVTRVALMAVLSMALLFCACAILMFSHLKVSASYKLEGTILDMDPSSATYGMLVDFSQTQDQELVDMKGDIFDITGAVPGVSQTATVVVTNNDIFALDYEIRVCDLVVDETKSADVALSKQMLITITYGSVVKEFVLADGNKQDSMVKIEDIAPEQEITFTVSAVFLDSDDFANDDDSTNDFDNADAIGGNVSFGIAVIAS